MARRTYRERGALKHGDDIASQIYDRLVDLDDSLRLVPELARELPTISEDMSS